MTNEPYSPQPHPEPQSVVPAPAPDTNAYPAYNPFAPPLGELATFWRRVGAYLLDQALYGLVVLPFATVGGVLIGTQVDCVTGTDDLTVTGSIPMVVGGAALIAVGLIVAALLYMSALARSGRTWGSQILGIEVVNAAGNPIGWGSALLRTAVACFGSSQLYWVGYLWMLGNPERQTWHDKIARTFVRRT